MALADAHPLGARPFRGQTTCGKFRALADGIVAAGEQDRILATVERLAELKAGELNELTFTVDPRLLGKHSSPGIFDWRHAAPVAAKRAAGQR